MHKVESHPRPRSPPGLWTEAPCSREAGLGQAQHKAEVRVRRQERSRRVRRPEQWRERCHLGERLALSGNDELRDRRQRPCRSTRPTMDQDVVYLVHVDFAGRDERLGDGTMRRFDFAGRQDVVPRAGDEGRHPITVRAPRDNQGENLIQIVALQSEPTWSIHGPTRASNRSPGSSTGG